MKPAFLAAIVVAGVVVIGVVAWSASPRPSGSDQDPPLPPPSLCPNPSGLCDERNVTRVVDGDTLDIEGGVRIRLVLVDAPEVDEVGGAAATAYLTELCLGTEALIDEDSSQIGDDPFGRVLAVAHCDGVNANAAMIASGHADTFFEYCSQSEFASQAWTGCASPPPPPPANCDPAYPTVCIPPPPPDLDCADIPYRRFTVLPPDPHHFDGDGDGIGCESG